MLIPAAYRISLSSRWKAWLIWDCATLELSAWYEAWKTWVIPPKNIDMKMDMITIETSTSMRDTPASASRAGSGELM
jgi:hypothetical protein